MALQLNRQGEAYKEFNGKAIDTMPLLIDKGLSPITFAQAMQRRLDALSLDERIRRAWWDYDIQTGDAILYHPDGKVKILLDSQLVRELNPASNLRNGALVLPEGAYEQFQGEEFSKKELDKYATGFPLTQRQALNNLIGRALARDHKFYEEYVRAVFKEAQRFFYNRNMMVYVHESGFDEGTVLRIWQLGSTKSNASGSNALDDIGYRLIGVSSVSESERNAIPSIERIFTLPTTAPIHMDDLKVEDMRRIDGLIQGIDGIWKNRPKRIRENSKTYGNFDVFSKSSRDYTGPFDISENDLEFLVAKGYVTTNTSQELFELCDGLPDDHGELRRRFNTATAVVYASEKNVDKLRAKLEFWRPISTKGMLARRNEELKQAEDELKTNTAIRDQLVSAHSILERSILINKGLYLTINSDISVQRLCDLDYEPAVITISDNSFDGKLLVYYPGGHFDYWGLNPHDQRHDLEKLTDDFELAINVPLDKLTGIVDLDTDALVAFLGKEMARGIRDVLSYPEIPSYRSFGPIGTLSLVDRLYKVSCRLTSINGDEKMQKRRLSGGTVVGTTNVGVNVDWIDDEGASWSSRAEQRDFYARPFQGTITLDLIFTRIKFGSNRYNIPHFYPKTIN